MYAFLVSYANIQTGLGLFCALCNEKYWTEGFENE